MKITGILFLSALIPILFSCTHQVEKSPKDSLHVATDTTMLESQKQKNTAGRRQTRAEYDADSVSNVKILQEAVMLSTQHINDAKFQESYVATMPDSAYQVQIDISSDFRLAKSSPHLVIRRQQPGVVYIDIFSKEGMAFKPVVSHEENALEYINDTLRDINGDGLKDLVVNKYGSSGCCLKAFSTVYLLRSDKKTFSDSKLFINPTFSPKEKIIRGVCYGHVGETEMYKYKWNGEDVDTVEYISYARNDKGEKTGGIIVSKKRFYWENKRIMKRLKSVPAEYKTIYGYDWFSGEGPYANSR